MIFKLDPACKDYLWGGNKLKSNFHKHFNSDRLAETWELSCHPDGLSVIADGPCKGRTLLSWSEEDRRRHLGTACLRFRDMPVLVKLIDAAKDLSVQVHPDNTYALEHEGQYGKTEMWYVLDAEEGAGIYYGFNKAVTQEEFRAAVANGTVCTLLRWVDVKKGDVFFIKAGTIHALGAGTVVAEIQQSSNVTYRVYDYGRLDSDGKPRALHIDKACEVMSTLPSQPTPRNTKHLARCDYFTVDKVVLGGAWVGRTDGTSFHCLLCVAGRAEVSAGETSISMQQGDCIFISADNGSYTIDGSCEILLTYVEAPSYRIGIDLGGTNIKTGLVDSDNRIIAKKSVPTKAKRPWHEVLDDMAAAVRDLLKEASLTPANCSGVGIGSPGTVDPETGVVIYSNNLSWDNVPVAETLKAALGLPVVLSNDANCAALGEFVAGSAKQYRSVVLLTLGTGVGGGAVINGELFEGGSAGAMELGHIALVAGGELCTCGRRGCLEAYASATGLIREGRKAAAAHPQSILNSLSGGDPAAIDGRMVFEAAKQGDKPAAAVVDQYIKWLGEGVIDVINIFRPEIVLLSGGVAEAGERLTQPLNDYVRRYTFACRQVKAPPVVCASLGNDAGIIGAANLTQKIK